MAMVRLYRVKKPCTGHDVGELVPESSWPISELERKLRKGVIEPTEIMEEAGPGPIPHPVIGDEGVASQLRKLQELNETLTAQIVERDRRIAELEAAKPKRQRKPRATTVDPNSMAPPDIDHDHEVDETVTETEPDQASDDESLHQGE